MYSECHFAAPATNTHTPFATHTVSLHCPCSSSGLCWVWQSSHSGYQQFQSPSILSILSHLWKSLFLFYGRFSNVMLTQVPISPSVPLAHAHTHTHILSPPLLHLSCPWLVGPKRKRNDSFQREVSKTKRQGSRWLKSHPNDTHYSMQRWPVFLCIYLKYVFQLLQIIL